MSTLRISFSRLTLHVGPAASPPAPAPAHPRLPRRRGPAVLPHARRPANHNAFASSPAPHGAALPALLAPPAADLPPAARVHGRTPVAAPRAATAPAKSFPEHRRAIEAGIMNGELSESRIVSKSL